LPQANEEKNPKLIFVHVHVDAMLACKLCLIHIRLVPRTTAVVLGPSQ